MHIRVILAILLVTTLACASQRTVHQLPQSTTPVVSTKIDEVHILDGEAVSKLLELCVAEEKTAEQIANTISLGIPSVYDKVLFSINQYLNQNNSSPRAIKSYGSYIAGVARKEILRLNKKRS